MPAQPTNQAVLTSKCAGMSEPLKKKLRNKTKRSQRRAVQKGLEDLRIKLDLDDGVKANYSKFGDLLAEVKAVTGGKNEE